MICLPGSSQCPKLLRESHISCRSNECQRHRFPAVLDSVIYQKDTKSSCWPPFFYTRGIVLFLLAEQLLLTAFSLQTCFTRLPRQTVEQLNCNPSNFIYMTSSGNPQLSPSPVFYLASHFSRTPAGLMVQSSILSGYKQTEIKSLQSEHTHRQLLCH